MRHFRVRTFTILLLYIGVGRPSSTDMRREGSIGMGFYGDQLAFRGGFVDSSCLSRPRLKLQIWSFKSLQTMLVHPNM